jgi:monovalent cation/proton antiporter MnhG/PhaG subunit
VSGRHLVALILLAIGTGLLVLAAIAVLALPDVHPRLHAGAPAAVLGAPLVTVALAVETGPGRAALKLLLIGAASAVGGTVTTTALGRAAAQREGRVGAEEPL